MISRELASALAPYLNWTPANGDRFYIPPPESAVSVLNVSGMVVELGTQHGAPRIHFTDSGQRAHDAGGSTGNV